MVRPCGKLVVSITDYTGLYREIQARFLMEAGGLPLAVGLRPDDPGSLRRAIRRLGAQVRPLPVVRGSRTLTVDEFLAHIEAGRYSWTWQATNEYPAGGHAEVARYGSPGVSVTSPGR